MGTRKKYLLKDYLGGDVTTLNQERLVNFFADLAIDQMVTDNDLILCTNSEGEYVWVKKNEEDIQN